MKKIINITIIIIALSLISGNVFSQNVQLKVAKKGEVVEKVKPKKEKVKTDFTRERGVYIRPAIGAGVILGNNNGHVYSPGFTGIVDLNIGYQVLPSLAVGLGIGYQFATGQYSYSYYKYNNDMNMSEATNIIKPYHSIPIYANLRWYMTDTKVQPYLDLKLGYLIGVKSSLVKVSRSYVDIGVPEGSGSGSNYFYGEWDSWNQYDDYAKMQGFHGALAIGFSVKNGFGLCLEATMVNIVYESNKVYHKEYRKNNMPEWEYEQLLKNRNQEKSVSSSAPYAKLHGMLSLKLEYNIPIIKKK